MAETERFTSAQLRPYRGGWRAQLRYKHGGTWRQKTKVLKAKGKREALRELTAWRAEMEREARGIKADHRPRDVGEFVARYVDGLEDTHAIQDSTARAYRYLQRLIAVSFEGTPHDELTAADVQIWLTDLMADRVASTARKALNLLKAAYRDAVSRHALPFSPVEAVRPPSVAHPEPNALTDTDRRRVLDRLEADPTDPAAVAVFLALSTGMRRGEICGLRWRDVDLKQGREAVAVRIVIGRGGQGYYTKPPKTKQSRRDIPLPPRAADLMRRYRKTERQAMEAAGVALDPKGYVFGDGAGHFMEPDSLWRAWRGIVQDMNLTGTEGRPPTFHDLRHTFATVAVASGADVKSVSSIMGHSNAAMTLNTYATADAEAKRAAMERIARGGEGVPGLAD